MQQPKSFIEQEFEKEIRYAISTYGRKMADKSWDVHGKQMQEVIHFNDVDDILQKAKEELRKKRYCKSEAAFHICKKHPEDCEYFIPYEEVEKVFGK